MDEILNREIVTTNMRIEIFITLISFASARGPLSYHSRFLWHRDQCSIDGRLRMCPDERKNAANN